jgi:hypothetical protein
MSNKINKINNLKKLQGFLQLNYAHGFKYVDKAGEFMNSLYKGEKYPAHIMEPTGMNVKLDEKTELKVSPHNFWMHFVEPDSFDIQRESFEEKLMLINSIFEPEKYTRIGWRSYLIYDCNKEYPKIVDLNFLKNVNFEEITFSKKFKDLNSKISISKLIKSENGAKAILFDLDIFYKEKINKENFSQIAIILKGIEDVYKSEELLELINKLLD